MSYLFFFFLPLGLQDAPSSGAIAKAVLTAQEANLAPITRGVIRYKYSRGLSPDQAAALSGRWSDRSVAQGLYAFDGKRGRLDQVFSPDDMASHTVRIGKMETSSTLLCVRRLTDGVATFRDDLFTSIEDGKSLLHNVSIVPGTSEFFDYLVFFAVWGPSGVPPTFHDYSELRGATAHEGQGRLDDGIETSRLDDGTEVVRIGVSTPELHMDYWVDMVHGAIPRRVRMSRLDGHFSSVVEYGDVRLVAGGVWLPFHCRRFSSGGASGLAAELRIEDADLNSALRDSLFQLEFSEPVGVYDLARSLQYSPQKIWDLSRLPRAGSVKAQPVTISEPPPPAPLQSGPRKATPWVDYCLITLGLSLLGIVGFRSIRSRRRTAST